MSMMRTVSFGLAATFLLLALDRAGQLRPPMPPTLQATIPSPAVSAPAQRRMVGTPGITPKALPPGIAHNDTVESLPPGKGQEEAFYTCAACHGTALIKAQGLSRELWDQTFQLMIDKHNMAEPDKTDRELIIDYLAQHFPPRRRVRDNPFLKN